MGTNHLGHAALTWLLIPDLARSDNPRRPNAAYAASKAANLLFTFELDRRARASGSPLLSIAAHPGVAPTDLGRKAALLSGRTTRWSDIGRTVARWPFGPVEPEPAPILHAVTADVEGGSYRGRDGLGGMRGRHPATASASPLVRTRSSLQWRGALGIVSQPRERGALGREVPGRDRVAAQSEVPDHAVHRRPPEHSDPGR